MYFRNAVRGSMRSARPALEKTRLTDTILRDLSRSEPVRAVAVAVSGMPRCEVNLFDHGDRRITVIRSQHGLRASRR